MPDIRPIGVEITQELLAAPATPVAPELRQLVVGVCRQVVTRKKAGSYAGLAVTLPLVELLPTSTVDATTARLFVVNQFGTFEVPKAATESTTEFALSATNNSVKLNTGLKIKRTSQVQSITGVVSKTGAGVTAVFTLTDPNAKFLSRLTRPVDGLKAFILVGTTETEITTWVSDTAVRITPASEAAGDALVAASPITYSVLTEEPAVGRRAGVIVDVLVSYAALRQDLVGIIRQVQGTVAAAEVFGPPDPLNPLGLAMFFATSINTTTAVAGTAIPSDDAVGHAVGIETATTERVYYICPVTNKKEVTQLYITHAQQLSLPGGRRERRVFINIPIPIEEIRVTTHTNATLVLNGATKTITATGETFRTAGVVPGNLFKFDSGGGVFKSLFIAHVPTETQLEFLSLTPLEGGAAYTGQTTFSVTTQLFTAEDKVKALEDFAQGIRERRVTFIEPDSFDVELAGADTTLDGGFLTSIIGAMYGAVEPGTSLSTIAVPLVKRVHGVAQFTEPLRRRLTSAGVFLLEQPFASSSPIIRHQVTTDTRNKKAQEASFTHAVDSIAFGLRDIITPLLGRNNITDEFLNMVMAGLDSIFTFFRDRRRRITAYEILDFGRSDLPGLDDAIVIKVKLSVPRVANNADVTLVL